MENGKKTNLSAISGRSDVEYCRITSDTAEVRSGIGTDFDTIATLNKDDVVKVLEEVDHQYVIQLNNNQVGSIDANDATPIIREGNPQQQPALEADHEPNNTGLETNPQGAEEETAPQINEPLNPPVTEEASPQQQSPQANPSNQRNTETSVAPPVEGLISTEEQMFNLVNQEREKNNLPLLEIDLELTRVARIKSQDMVDQNYFSHYSPTYGSPFEMLDSFGIKYLHAGENLAGNSSVENAHTSLMNSSGHRKNILSPDYTHIGIGVKPSDEYGQIFTQLFISKPQ